jgi:hypothetical protein
VAADVVYVLREEVTNELAAPRGTRFLAAAASAFCGLAATAARMESLPRCGSIRA